MADDAKRMLERAWPSSYQDEPVKSAPRCERMEKGAPDARRSGPATGTNIGGMLFICFV